MKRDRTPNTRLDWRWEAAFRSENEFLFCPKDDDLKKKKFKQKKNEKSKRRQQTTQNDCKIEVKDNDSRKTNLQMWKQIQLSREQKPLTPKWADSVETSVFSFLTRLNLRFRSLLRVRWPVWAVEQEQCILLFQFHYASFRHLLSEPNRWRIIVLFGCSCKFQHSQCSYVFSASVTRRSFVLSFSFFSFCSLTCSDYWMNVTIPFKRIDFETYHALALQALHLALPLKKNKSVSEQAFAAVFSHAVCEKFESKYEAVFWLSVLLDQHLERNLFVFSVVIVSPRDRRNVKREHFKHDPSAVSLLIQGHCIVSLCQKPVSVSPDHSNEVKEGQLLSWIDVDTVPAPFLFGELDCFVENSEVKLQLCCQRNKFKCAPRPRDRPRQLLPRELHRFDFDFFPAHDLKGDLLEQVATKRWHQALFDTKVQWIKLLQKRRFVSFLFPARPLCIDFRALIAVERELASQHHSPLFSSAWRSFTTPASLSDQEQRQRSPSVASVDSVDAFVLCNCFSSTP